MLLPVDRTDFLIHLPASLILNSEGLSIFTRGSIPLKRLKDLDGRLGEGLSSKNFNAQSVQKLVINGYLSEILVRLPELLASRTQIMDTTKLVVFGILYKKLNPALAHMLINSSIMKAFNRKNPRNQINSLANIDQAKMEILLKARAEDFSFMELEIRNEVVQMIISDEKLEEEDRLLRMRSLDKFVAFIDKRIWYLYYVVYQTPLKDEVHLAFSKMIAQYLDRTKIATHLATMVMEIVQNSEKAHLERLIHTSGLGKSDSEINVFLKEASNRKYIVEQARKRNEMIDVAWRFDSGHASTGKPYKIEITISNYGLISMKMQRMLNDKMQQNTKNLNLSDFYQESNDDTKLGAGLGLLYLSYLEEECRNANLQFSSNIYPDPQAQKTTTKIKIVF